MGKGDTHISRQQGDLISLLFTLLFLFWKNKLGLREHHAVCVSVYPIYQLLCSGASLYETWYVYHGT
jgi:hypothetical protein